MFAFARVDCLYTVCIFFIYFVVNTAFLTFLKANLFNYNKSILGNTIHCTHPFFILFHVYDFAHICLMLTSCLTRCCGKCQWFWSTGSYNVAHVWSYTCNGLSSLWNSFIQSPLNELIEVSFFIWKCYPHLDICIELGNCWARLSSKATGFCVISNIRNANDLEWGFLGSKIVWPSMRFLVFRSSFITSQLCIISN